MTWSRLKLPPNGHNNAIIYRATRTCSGILLEATDLSKVWIERLNDTQVITRATELGSIIALDSRQDITELFGLLKAELDTPTKIERNGSLELEYAIELDETNTQKWYFKCSELPVEDAGKFLGAIVHELFEVISDLNAELIAEKSNSKQLRYHIRNLSRICAKEAPYKPHRFQESYQEVVDSHDTVESDAVIPSDGIPSSPGDIPKDVEKWQQGLSISSRFLADRLETKDYDQSQSDADVTIIPSEDAKPTRGSPPSLGGVDSSHAFSQALSQFSQDKSSQRETAEELKLKMQRQRVNSRKRRRF